MNSGRYKNRVSIRRLKSTATQDAHGQIDNTDADNWEELCSTWVGCVSREAGGDVDGDIRNAHRR